MAELRGVITAMVTPFAADGAVDVDATRRLARYLIDNGSHGLVVAGTTGESPTLSDDEKLRLFDIVLDEVGDEATVIAGTGSNDTRHAAGLTGKACAVGVHGVLVVTPYYNKPNRAGLRAHFEEVSEAAGQLPVVIYNIPSRTVINLPPDLLAELAAEHENVVAVKQANNDDLGPIEGLEILAGNDEMFAAHACLGRQRRHPGRLARRGPGNARHLRRLHRRRSRAGRRDRLAPATDLRGDDGDQQPDPGKDRPGDAWA